MRRRTATVELFEQIRREYEFGIGTIQGVARQFGVHRRLVREAVQTAVPRQTIPRWRSRPLEREAASAPCWRGRGARRRASGVGRGVPEVRAPDSVVADVHDVVTVEVCRVAAV